MLTAVLATACASPRWENPHFPDANLKADLAQCQQDAERVSRLSHMRKVAEQTMCFRQGVDCMPLPENQTAESVAAGQGMARRCMANKGWTHQ